MFNKIIFFALCLFSFFVVDSKAEPQLFPFVGDVTGEKVNVRAGLSENFEVLGQVSRGQELVVVAKEYGWYKIELPPDFPVFISDKYIQDQGDGKGIVTGDKVNVRAGLDVNRTALGQLVKGDTVRIINHHNEWYEIASTPKVYGWIHEGFLAYKSQDTTGVRLAENNARVESTDAIVKDDTAAVEVVPVVDEMKEVAVETGGRDREGFFQGNLQPLGGVDIQGASYQLVVDGKPSYYVSGFQYILDDFLYYDVKIEGEPESLTGKAGPVPAIKASRIELVL